MSKAKEIKSDSKETVSRFTDYASLKKPKKPERPNHLKIDEVVGYYPNAVTRKLLAEQWKHMSTEEQTLLRAQRCKRGIRCDICGLGGYYRDNCPNKCQSPPPTPDSTASTPRDFSPQKQETPKMSPVKSKEIEDKTLTIDPNIKLGESGFFWGTLNQNSIDNTSLGSDGYSLDGSTTSGFGSLLDISQEDNEKKTFFQLKRKIDLSAVRPLAEASVKEFRNTDKAIGNKMFYLNSNHMYSRNYAELSLQQIMRRMMRLLEKELLKNSENLEAKFDTSLLAPPSEKITDTFYNKELMNIPLFRDYYLKYQQNKIRKEKNLNYKFQGCLRPMDDLDPIFRGGQLTHDDLYKTRANAGESIHAKNTWKSILARHDNLANSDPTLAKKQENLNILFKNQSKWIINQQKAMQYKNDRFEHILYILNQEIKIEHQRETRLLLAEDKKEQKVVALNLWRERLASVDMMMQILQAYKFASGLDEADFLLFCLDQWHEESLRHVSSIPYNKRHNAYLKEKQLFAEQMAKMQTDNDKNSTVIPPSNENEDTVVETKDKEGGDNLPSMPTMEAQDPSTEGKQAKKKSKGSKGIDMVAAATNPYFQDIEFLKQVTRKHEKLYLQSRSGKVFSAAEERTLKQKQLMEELAKLERGNDNEPQPQNHSYSSIDISVLPRQTSETSFSKPGLSRSNTASSALSYSPSEKDKLEIIPFDELLQQAELKSKEIQEEEQEKNRQKELLMQKLSTVNESPIKSGKKDKNKEEKPHRRRHPREIDQEKIMNIKKSFKLAGLGSRIRKGVDDDFAMALPALIPIPQAFDGNSETKSYTASNIVFQLKKDMVLSDLGYTPQHAVPLYIRNTVLEKEGTSILGDPTQEELAKDRRYSHWLGRPLIRFNPDNDRTAIDAKDNKTIPEKEEKEVHEPSFDLEPSLDLSTLTGVSKEPHFKTIYPLSKADPSIQKKAQEEIERLTQLKQPNYMKQIQSKVILDPIQSQLEEKRALEAKLKEERHQRRMIKLEMEAAKDIPITKSLVRMVFTNPEPSLADLQYLDEMI